MTWHATHNFCSSRTRDFINYLCTHLITTFLLINGNFIIFFLFLYYTHTHQAFFAIFVQVYYFIWHQIYTFLKTLYNSCISKRSPHIHYRTEFDKGNITAPKSKCIKTNPLFYLHKHWGQTFILSHLFP